MTSDAPLGYGLVALSIDHGSVSGHSPLELLHAIMHRLQWDVMTNKECHPWLHSLEKDPENPIIRPHEVFDMIVGSGTGGLIAGLLGSMKLPVDEAMEEYLSIARLLFPVKKTNNTKKLETALKALVRKHKGEKAPMIDPQHRFAQASGNSFILAHVAANMRGTIPAKFRSYDANDVDVVNCELWEALRATTADLGLFDDFFIQGEKYWGTSMGNGNPTQHLCDEIKQLYPGKRADLILSLGCGHPDTIYLAEKSTNPAKSTSDVYDTLLNLRKDCEKTHDSVFLHWSEKYPDSVAAGPYYRLSVEQGIQGMADLPLDPNTSSTVLTHSRQYLRAPGQKQLVNAIVRILLGKILQKSMAIVSSKPLNIPSAPSPPPNELAGPKRVLALDGGGLFGVAEMLLLRDIIGGPDKRPCEYFDLIAGSGTGGIFAILLARFKLTIQKSIEIFENIMEPMRTKIKDGTTLDTKALTTVFSKSLSSNILALQKHKHNTKGQKSSDQIGAVTMFGEDSLSCKAFVLCNALENMNAERPRFLGTYRSLNCKDNVSIHDAIRATTAGRSLFEDAKVQFSILSYERFGGTSYANNNPTYHLIEEAKQLWPNHSHPFVVSLGAGQVQQIPLPGSFPSNEKHFFKALQEISEDCERTHNHLQESLDLKLYHRFNIIQGLGNGGQGQWSFKALADSMRSNTLNISQSQQQAMRVAKSQLDKMLEKEMEATRQTEEQLNRIRANPSAELPTLHLKELVPA